MIVTDSYDPSEDKHLQALPAAKVEWWRSGLSLEGLGEVICFVFLIFFTFFKTLFLVLVLSFWLTLFNFFTCFKNLFWSTLFFFCGPTFVQSFVYAILIGGWASQSGVSSTRKPHPLSGVSHSGDSSSLCNPILSNIWPIFANIYQYLQIFTNIGQHCQYLSIFPIFANSCHFPHDI